MVSARCTKRATGIAGMAVRATSREEMELVCIGLLIGDAEPGRDGGVGGCGTSQSAAACAVAGVDPALKNLPMGFLKAKRAWRAGTPQRFLVVASTRGRQSRLPGIGGAGTPYIAVIRSAAAEAIAQHLVGEMS